MAYTSLDWVKTPSETTPFDYTANLAVMASSIESKVGRYVYSAEGTATLTDTTNFEAYTPGNVIRCVREGKWVTVTTTWKCKTANYLQGTTNRVFARLPAGFRPKYYTQAVVQGSGSTRYFLQIAPDGDISAARADTTHNNNFWMPISIVFLAED